MTLKVHVLRTLLSGAALLIGVTFLSFVLMVYFGPPLEYTLLGKNPTAEQIESVRDALHLNDPFFARYLHFLHELVTLDFGRSIVTGQPVGSLLARTVPISLGAVLPGFVLGNLVGLGLAMVAAHHRGGWVDRAIMAASVSGMSVSLIIVVIVAQVGLCSPLGLNLFPSRGWRVHGFGDYLLYATVPTLTLAVVALGYNTRFYRTVLVEAAAADYVRTARAYGATPRRIMLGHVLPNALIPITTRVLFTVPLIVVSGSLVIESFFGIPGIGQLTFDAIQSNDQPVLKAVVSLTAVLFVIVLTVSELLYNAVDPRLSHP
ncbi:MAG: ABC transporter permease [Pseudomonadota bacterium]